MGERWGQYIKLLWIRGEEGEKGGHGLWAQVGERHGREERHHRACGCGVIECLSLVVSDLGLMLGRKRSMMARVGKESGWWVCLNLCVFYEIWNTIFLTCWRKVIIALYIFVCHPSLQCKLMALNIQLWILCTIALSIEQVHMYSSALLKSNAL